MYENLKKCINRDNFSLVDYRFNRMLKDKEFREYVLPEKMPWYNSNKKGLSGMLVPTTDNGPADVLFRAKILEGDGEFNYLRRR